ncbi:MAG: O-antigen ligase family protein, partial [Acidimicrobiales bacterium]
AIGFFSWRNRWVRLGCVATIVLGPVAIIMTYTRTNWVAAAAGVLMAMLFDRHLRRWIPAVGAAGILVVLGTFVADPHLLQRASARTTEVSPIWDRYNIARAGMRAWEAHPMFGVGWMTFPVKGPAYMRQAATYPLTGVGLEVHNAFIERLAENGLPLTLLWVWALVTGIGGAIVRRCPPELLLWRLGLVAIATAWFVAANLDPMAYPLPNLLIWLWAGIVARDRYSCRVPVVVERRPMEPLLVG